MLRQQADGTPPGQWVRVVGGWGGAQFAEKRLPTVSELSAAAPDIPVLVLHLYQSAILNRAAWLCQPQVDPLFSFYLAPHSVAPG